MANEKDTADICKGLLTPSCKGYSLQQQTELVYHIVSSHARLVTLNISCKYGNLLKILTINLKNVMLVKL